MKKYEKLCNLSVFSHFHLSLYSHCIEHVLKLPVAAISVDTGMECKFEFEFYMHFIKHLPNEHEDNHT
jgi:hypothetical protein